MYMRISIQGCWYFVSILVYAKTKESLAYRKQPSVHRKRALRMQKKSPMYTEKEPYVRRQRALCTQKKSPTYTEKEPYVNWKPAVPAGAEGVDADCELPQDAAAGQQQHQEHPRRLLCTGKTSQLSAKLLNCPQNFSTVRAPFVCLIRCPWGKETRTTHLQKNKSQPSVP